MKDIIIRNFDTGCSLHSFKKDYSNIHDVINKIKDDNFLQKMSDRTYNDTIKSGLYSYKILFKSLIKKKTHV